ncbi:hypothetical protein [Terribacillus sp. AE2B 122]|uniref:hypothetical protein n=1 Tax=Terribacillus sp. AE2B 122 TaxID=1331902 RepID=UPI0015825F98|nr:hypothetical protein [Terribacillus sp. AE2B 122]
MNIFEFFSLYTALTTAIGTVGFFLVKRYIAGRVKHHFNTELADHKHDLSLISEEHKHGLQLISRDVEHDYQKRIHQFSLISSKIHEVYPELYMMINDLMVDFQRSTSRLKTRLMFLSNTEADLQKIRDYLVSKEIHEDVIEDIITEYKFDKQKGDKKYTQALDLKQLHNTDKKRYEVYMKLLSAELYLPSDLSKLILNLLDLILDVILEEQNRIEFGFEGKRTEYYTNLSDKTKELSEIKEKIKISIQKELNFDHKPDSSVTEGTTS